MMKIITSFILSFGFWAFTISASPAIEAFKQKDYSQAKSLFLKNSDDAEANYYLARIAFIEGELDEAEGLMLRAMDSEENNPDYHYWFARISARQASNASIFSAPGYASAARTHFERALQLDPKNTQTFRGLISFYTQAPAIAGGSYKKALAMTEKLAQLSYELALISKVDIYREKEDTEKELATARELIEKYPGSPRALTKAGFSFQLAKQYQFAFELFTQASEIHDEGQENSVHSALYQIGRTAALSETNTEKGAQALEEYLQLPIDSELPSKEWAKYRLASLYLKLGKAKLAQQLANEAIQNTEEKRLKRRAKFLLRKIP